MSRSLMIREPEVVHREKGFPRWAVEWGLFDPETFRSSTRRKKFLTQTAAERWIERKRTNPARQFRSLREGRIEEVQ